MLHEGHTGDDPDVELDDYGPVLPASKPLPWLLSTTSTTNAVRRSPLNRRIRAKRRGSKVGANPLRHGRTHSSSTLVSASCWVFPPFNVST